MASYKFTAVITRHPFGFPKAWPVVVEKDKKTGTKIYICLSDEERHDLEIAAKQTGTCKDGLAWCAQPMLVEYGPDYGELVVLKPARGGWINGEEQAILTDNIIGRVPIMAFEGEAGNRKPAHGMNWREANTVEAVHLAHALYGKK
jgi:hypothetical protein